MKLSISLKKPKETPQQQPVLQASAFGADSEDIVENKSKGPIAHAAQTSRALQKRLDAEMKVDANLYEYDELWDKMQEAKERQQLAKQEDKAARKPKYIHGLLASASTRKLDHLRAEEKMMQREREAEGDLYKDKETFVTQAYKDQMEEVRRAEEEEKKRDEARKKQGNVSTGLTHFYRQLLEQDEQKHQETVAATNKRVFGAQAGPNLTITRPDMAHPADVDLARMAQAEGKDVELNDDGQIVDKRELLSAGLNLSLPNTRRLGKTNLISGQPQPTQTAVQTHRAVGIAASRREINERRAREIQEQMVEEEQRVEWQKQLEAERVNQRATAKRNNDLEVENARARYQERKRLKLEGQQEGSS